MMDRSSSPSRPRTRSDSQDDSTGQAALFRDATGAPLPRACVSLLLRPTRPQLIEKNNLLGPQCP
jgi:hypothetical protein